MITDLLRTLALCGAGTLSACHTHASPDAGAPLAAVLASADEDTMSALKSALSDAMGGARVTLGPSDLMQTSTISVLPPRPTVRETHSLAIPVHFDLALRGDQCVVVRRDTGETFNLHDIACRPRD